MSVGLLGTFKGTKTEGQALSDALAHNCTCAGLPGSPPCPAHSLLTDTRLMDHLLFARHCAVIFAVEEWQL